MPKDPSSASGSCKNVNLWAPPLKSWQTGGAGAGHIASSVLVSLAWPPPTISNVGAPTLLPSYTPTGAVQMLPGHCCDWGDDDCYAEYWKWMGECGGHCNSWVYG